MQNLKKKLRETHDLGPQQAFIIFDLKLAAVMRIEELEKCLKEAMKWNWLDEDCGLPKDLVKMCNEVLDKD